jgi:glycyl-tRNA synthetase beta chain
MAELLLELFSEEIPARMQNRAREDLARLLGDKLKAAGLDFDEIRTFATVRRLTAVVEGLPKRSPDVHEERKGPRVDAPEAAINGFLKSAGLKSVDQAETREDKKGSYYVALLEKLGRATADVVAEIVPEIAKTFPWSKSMRWGSGKLRWVRPLHSVLCLFDGKVVDFEIDGIKSGKETRGHRFMAPKPFAVKNFKDYVEKLKDAFVILDGEERTALILKDAKALARKKGLTLVEDEGLLAENAGLTEWPVVLMGEFDKDFLSVPPEVLATAMKAHQKCFSVRKGDALANRFIVVANLEAKDGGKAITAGNECVIRARLADAKFFFDQDRKVSLEDRVPKLKEITFHEKLGTQYDRVQRIFRLAREIAPLVGADPDLAERAAVLAKADLVTDMVGEFPELQGVMGYYYALDQKENPAVAEAVAAQYKPVGPTEEVPRDPIAIAVALADKLDTLTGFWAVDEKPTGSKDPFALRRAALGVLRIMIEKQLNLNLVQLLQKAADDYQQVLKDMDSAAVVDQCYDFIMERARGYFLEAGVAHDVFDAVLAQRPEEPFDFSERVTAVTAFRRLPEAESLSAANKRIANILKKVDRVDTRIDESLLQDAAEKDLYQTLNQLTDTVTPLFDKRDYQQALSQLAKLREPVDRFFDDVMVMADDNKLKNNRLALLQSLRSLFLRVADLSRLQS